MADRSCFRSLRTLGALGVALAIAMHPIVPMASPLVLNCEIEEGAPEQYRSIQIMIDEEENIVVYHYDKIGEEYIRKYNWENGVKQTIDLSMKITMKSDKFIVANDQNGAIVITKHDAKFVYAFVSPIPLRDGTFMAFGNTHWGRCFSNPF